MTSEIRSAGKAPNTRIPSTQTIGEVAKRSNAADCKSVALAASKVRVLPSPPALLAVFDASVARPASGSDAREVGRGPGKPDRGGDRATRRGNGWEVPWQQAWPRLG